MVKYLIFKFCKEKIMENAKGFIEEFKEFISRGNVIELAVGIIIGSAFTAIVNSIVNDLIMPIIGVIMGGVNFNSLKIVLKEATFTTEEVAIFYGSFIQSVINFLIIAFVIFMVVKALNKFKKQEEVAEEAPSEPAEEVLLLREIRDSLKK